MRTIAKVIAKVLVAILLTSTIMGCVTANYHNNTHSNKLITLTVHNSDPHDIFIWIANQMSLSLSIYRSPSLDLALSHPTSLEAKRVKANDLLDDLCYNYNCKWSIENKTLFIKGDR